MHLLSLLMTEINSLVIRIAAPQVREVEMKNDEYVLRPLDQQEINRLELQHQVWKNETDTVIRMAKFKAGDRLLDLGSGPGFLTWDLAKIVGPEGSVLALENSKEFIQHVLLEVKAQQMPWIRAEIADVRTYDLEPSSLDGAICRWVLMFIAGADQALARVTHALRPGGMIAVMEYTQFRSMSLWPRGASFKRVYEAVHEFIARNGGDADIGGRVPALLDQAGCEIVELLCPYGGWADPVRHSGSGSRPRARTTPI